MFVFAKSGKPSDSTVVVMSSLHVLSLPVPLGSDRNRMSLVEVAQGRD